MNTYSGSFITTKNSFKIKYYKNITSLSLNPLINTPAFGAADSGGCAHLAVSGSSAGSRVWCASGRVPAPREVWTDGF